ncbi:sugar ABC transporter substrate-binding protein [Paenibacillus darwinianus]|nr:sugar ABC transporter substrate-binding protein [Paenibacillus darwinianus]
MLTVAVLFILSIVISACGGAGSQNTAPASSEADSTASSANASSKPADAEKKSYYFIFVPKLIHPWYENVKVGAQVAIDELKAKGIEVKMEWDAPPVADIIQHSQKVEAAIAKKPDVLAVAALDPPTTTPIINQGIKNGIPIITFEADAAQSDRATFVGNNHNDKDGEVLAEYLAEKIGYKGEVAILLGSLGAPSHKQRVEGFKKVMAKYPDIKIVDEQADNDSWEKAAQLTESMLQANPNLKGIFANNAGNPIGAARAVKDAGKAGKVLIVGMDDAPETMSYLKEGVIAATVVQKVPDIGYKAIYDMIDLLNGKTLPKVDEIESYIVTKDNLAEYEKNNEKFKS